MEWIVYSLIGVIAGLTIVGVNLFADREDARSQIFNLKVVNRQQRAEMENMRQDLAALRGTPVPPVRRLRIYDQDE